MKISERLIRMVDRKGFIDVFWETLKEQQKVNSKITHRECYEMMEADYIKAFSRRRYASYEAFRRRRDK